MPVSELVPGKLYQWCSSESYDRAYIIKKWKTVLCLKYEDYNNYKKMTFLVIGRPNQPVIEEMVDRFYIQSYLDNLEELTSEE